MIENSALAISLLVLLGTFTGFISGMLGIGGGTVVVPALVIGLPFLGIGGPDLPKIAVATSLALVIPTSIASAQAHMAKGGVDWRMLMLLAPSIVAGALLTAIFATIIDAHFVMLVFVLFALYTAWGLLRAKRTQLANAQRPHFMIVATKGAVGGTLSALLGLGVGFFCVPLLSRFLAMPRAIGTAAALALPMSIVGTAGYLLASSPTGCTEQCMGYVFLPAVAAIGISAVLAAPLGAWAAHVMPVLALKRAFAVFLLFAAGNLAYKTFTPEVIAAEGRRIAFLAGRLMPTTSTASREALNIHDDSTASTLADIKVNPQKLMRLAITGAVAHYHVFLEAKRFALPYINSVFQASNTEKTASIPPQSRLALEVTPLQLMATLDWGREKIQESRLSLVNTATNLAQDFYHVQLNVIASEEARIREALLHTIWSSRAADQLRLIWWRNVPHMRPKFVQERRLNSKFYVPNYEYGLKQIQ